MVMSEYCQSKRLTLVYQEVFVESLMFGSQCSIDGKLYAVGIGKTKKDAKTHAAQKAFTSIVGDNYCEPGDFTV